MTSGIEGRRTVAAPAQTQLAGRSPIAANEEKSPRDAFTITEVERALALYRGLVPPALLETLEDALRSHPVAVELLDQLSERAAPQRSDDLPREGAAQLDLVNTTRQNKKTMRRVE